jgi:protoheme IX farnesyltransferase
MQLSRFAKFAWAVLVWNVIVVLWGAFVRATGSGAGCGNHWPLCNGQVVPRAPQVETLIELSHRLTSGVALIGVLILLIWAFRAYPRRHPVRWGAVVSAVFIITESLVGAGLVIFGWVADDTSAERAVVVSIHLFNTFLLVASLAVTAWWASDQRPIALTGRGWLVWALRAGLLGVLVIGISGAITALGDTLFPAASLAEGLRQDMDPSQHFLIQLRIWHPLLSILVGVYLLVVTRILRSQETSPTVDRLGRILSIVIVVQLAAGFVNVLLLAPVWMQIVHLLLADLVWISLVLLSASVAAVPVPRFEAATQPIS